MDTYVEHRPRGRPRKIPVQPIEQESLQYKVAAILSSRCTILGCSPKWHLTDADAIIKIVRENE